MQKNSKFHRRDLLYERVFEIIIHAKAKAWVFPTCFAVILSAVALPIVLKAEFNFELICTLSFLFSKVQAAALNPLSVFKTLFSESPPIALLSSQGKIIHMKSLRAPFTLIFHSEAIWTSSNVFPFNFKCQRSNLSVLGMKTRPWKFVDLARNAPWERVVWRQRRPSLIAQGDRVSLKILTMIKLNLLLWISLRQSIGALGRRDFYFRPCWQKRPLLAGKIFRKAEA